VAETPVPAIPTTPPLAELLPVLAPLLPELTPALPTIPDVPRAGPAPAPVVPDVASPATAVDKSIALPVAPAARIVAAVPSSSLGAPTMPTRRPSPPGPIADAIAAAGFSNPISLERPDPIAATAPSGRDEGPAGFVAEDPGANPFAVHLEAPGGAAPAGSSLLAVLASYVLPGGGSLPPTTLFLFLSLAVILAVALAPRPGAGERLVLLGLLRSLSGHQLAVRRPG
jgi:hypothetical protein